MTILQDLKGAASLRDFAAVLDYKPKTLSYIVYKIPPTQKYSKFSISKSAGGEREICAPTGSLKGLQRRLADVLYDCRGEFESQTSRRPLSHGFRRDLSIVTNARQHKRRRYVLNLDLQDFFPTFNFGRVRGFFIRNRHFELNENVATIIAQISCFENTLPQGSPCSPVIADLIAHLLDVRLAQLARHHKLTYSRYADDITFSTGQKAFPPSIAAPIKPEEPIWELGDELSRVIEKSGFVVNPTKTRMQFSISHQVVTGLTVNSKVNIRPEYYRRARAMCHSLFETGSYYRTTGIAPPKHGPDEQSDGPEWIESLEPIEGVLSHIHYVKDSIDIREEIKKRKKPTAARKLYAGYLKYRYFVRLERPLLVCEGKTDSVYLKCAIRMLDEFQPMLGSWDGKRFVSSVSFFNYNNRAHRILELNGGIGDLLYFFIKSRYERDIRGFKHRPLRCPVIVLIDNDDGANKLFSTILENYKISIDFKSSEEFFHLTENLYLVKTPETGKNGKSCIESLFQSSLLETEIEGKKFNPRKDLDPETEYGKAMFADKIVRLNTDNVDFKGFKPLLERIVSVITHYSARLNPVT